MSALRTAIPAHIINEEIPQTPYLQPLENSTPESSAYSEDSDENHQMLVPTTPFPNRTPFSIPVTEETLYIYLRSLYENKQKIYKYDTSPDIRDSILNEVINCDLFSEYTKEHTTEMINQSIYQLTYESVNSHYDGFRADWYMKEAKPGEFKTMLLKYARAICIYEEIVIHSVDDVMAYRRQVLDDFKTDAFNIKQVYDNDNLDQFEIQKKMNRYKNDKYDSLTKDQISFVFNEIFNTQSDISDRIPPPTPTPTPIPIPIPIPVPVPAAAADPVPIDNVPITPPSPIQFKPFDFKDVLIDALKNLDVREAIKKILKDEDTTPISLSPSPRPSLPPVSLPVPVPIAPVPVVPETSSIPIPQHKTKELEIDETLELYNNDVLAIDCKTEGGYEIHLSIVVSEYESEKAHYMNDIWVNSNVTSEDLVNELIKARKVPSNVYPCQFLLTFPENPENRRHFGLNSKLTLGEQGMDTKDTLTIFLPIAKSLLASVDDDDDVEEEKEEKEKEVIKLTKLSPNTFKIKNSEPTLKRKRGGRKPGSKNKITLNIPEYLRENQVVKKTRKPRKPKYAKRSIPEPKSETESDEEEEQQSDTEEEEEEQAITHKKRRKDTEKDLNQNLKLVHKKSLKL